MRNFREFFFQRLSGKSRRAANRGHRGQHRRARRPYFRVAGERSSLVDTSPTYFPDSLSTRLGESYPYRRYLVRLVFPFAAFHPVVLIDVADVKPASTANRVARLPVCGAVHYVIVGTALEPVGASFPPQFVTSFAPAHRVGARTPYSFVLPGAALH